ncbi:unnamed protein product, partial [Amoebophrya sp. A25]
EDAAVARYYTVTKAGNGKEYQQPLKDPILNREHRRFRLQNKRVIKEGAGCTSRAVSSTRMEGMQTVVCDSKLIPRTLPDAAIVFKNCIDKGYEFDLGEANTSRNVTKGGGKAW